MATVTVTSENRHIHKAQHTETAGSPGASALKKRCYHAIRPSICRLVDVQCAIATAVHACVIHGPLCLVCGQWVCTLWCDCGGSFAYARSASLILCVLRTITPLVLCGKQQTRKPPEAHFFCFNCFYFLLFLGFLFFF